ncbi:AraC family transcriptional regulator [Paenibacillus polymyxa]|uniref:AraC family transcriptional regulator n=1 Tax=Paenibacillus polymyxa TaxID=1406 RepID=UPI002AB418DD|nr:AraC family transcriptional regulator [Paenibacillus polymyxa]MDY8091431.1 AraC family transcriptional regulator [Paenibacillus polymyxa]
MNGSLFEPRLRDGDYIPRFFAYYYKQWHDYTMSYHDHHSTEIMYMISGFCRVDVQTGENTEESITLRKGEFIMLDAGVPHRLVVEGEQPCRMLNVEFGFTEGVRVGPSIRQIATEEQEVTTLMSRPFPYLVLSDPEEVYYALKSLVLELDQRKEQPGAMAEMLFMQLLVRIARLREEAERSNTQQTDMYIKRCIEFLHLNYDREIVVKDMAAAVNLHPGYLHRIFKKHTGLTLTAYLTMLRMDKARMLLQQTDIPIQEIADYVGVASRQYFHMLFKKHTGQTPVEYRSAVERNVRNYAEEDGN